MGTTISLQRSKRHHQRYQEIAEVFLRHGFGYLIERLGPEWAPPRPPVRSADQSASPVTEQDLPAHFRQALEELGPTFVKLGQVLSTRPDLLPPAYVAELSKLQDAVPPVPWEAIRDAITQELGRPPEEIFASIDPEPLGAASLGQVHAATLADGAEVVIKVQRPNIQPTIATDLEILQALAPAAQRTPEGQIHDFVAEADDFAYTLNNELDYRLEGRNADRFRANFANQPLLYVPHVYWEYTTERVLVLERISGVKIDDVAAVEEAGYDRHQVAENAARMVIKEVLEDGFFHADVHPGNFVVMPGEVIGVMDFGRMGYLSDRDRYDAIGFYVAIMSMDPDGIVDQLIRMGAAASEVDRKALARDIERVLYKYYSVSLGNIRIQGLSDVAMPIINCFHLRLPSNFVLLLQTLGMMQGIAMILDPGFDVWSFSEPYMRRVARRLAKPRRGQGQNLLRQGREWSELVSNLPRIGNRLLEKAERGDLLQIGLKDTGPLLRQIDRVATRLALSLLLAALTISLALLLSFTNAGSLLQAPVTVGFAMTIALTAWLFISILKGTR
jgi:ubiquinone biosynthesis protein